MEIKIFELEAQEEKCFGEFLDRNQVDCISEALSEDNAEQHAEAEIVSTFIYSELSRKVLEKLPELKLIATRSTGYDHIDLKFCRENGIKVCNVPSYGDVPVAEHVFALLLAISHRIIEAADRTRKGDFSPRGLRGFDLKGKTLGVIGTGNIGQQVIRSAKGFGMPVLAYDVKPRKELEEELGFEYTAFDHLLEQSDVVSLHVPATEKTRNLIGQEQFDRMKKGVVMINTARGSVVEVESLLKALSAGKLRGAGLDVLPEEPTVREEAEVLKSVYEKKHNLSTILADHVLLRLRDVIITPHNAFNTDEANQQIVDTTVENIQGFLQGNPQNIVSE